MKTTFKVKRGHVWHVVHETKTGHAKHSAWTLCGQYYDDGEHGTKTPTCPGCLKIDNPLTLPSTARYHLENILRPDAPAIGVNRGARDPLIKADYITFEDALTRRGAILAEDFNKGPVPLADEVGVVHARKPLDHYPACHRNGRLFDTDRMTTERYAKLRMVSDQVVVTCLQCVARDNIH